MFIKVQQNTITKSFAWALLIITLQNHVSAEGNQDIIPGNFGLPGIIDLPSKTTSRWGISNYATTSQVLARSGIAFQALPKIGFSFRYSGHGKME